MSVSADFEIDVLEVMKARKTTNILSQLFLSYRPCEERTAVVFSLYFSTNCKVKNPGVLDADAIKIGAFKINYFFVCYSIYQ